MPTFKRFEDIVAWQKARLLTGQIYSITRQGNFVRDFALRDQIRRAGISVMANIAEGFGRNSDREFANFLNIAIGSANEVQSHLYVALDQAYIVQPTFDSLYEIAAEACRISKARAQRLRNT